MDYFFEENDWAVALYEKRGRAYTEVGVFFEGQLSRDTAFELFAGMTSAVPTLQAVQRALEVEENEPDVPTPEYEVRLIDGKRIVATILWDSASMEACKADHKIRNRKVYRVVTEIQLYDDDLEMDSEEWDWEELSETGRITVLEIKPKI
jgi:hypothetical protein